jgi:SpoVK/Ycf46/Vps4 family AAA+-type ATPase
MNDHVFALREALAASPDNIPLRMLIARTLLGEGDAAGALGEFQEVLKRAPDKEEALVAAGSAALQLGESKQVVEHWWPVRGKLALGDRLELAKLVLKMGREADAKELYSSIIQEDSSVRDIELDRAFRGQRLKTAEPADAAPIPPSNRRPTLRFADVGGLDSLKERLRMDIVYPLQKPELFRAYGKQAGGGVLLYGPPGCGKTHLARAAAGECGATFLPVEIPQVLDMWLGESEKRLHALFEQARAEAPTILFFDEVEALAAARHQIKHGPGRRLVNQLLTELDGVQADNASVLVLGATNAPWDVDPALRRPGRFDRVVFVPPPDLAAREQILTLAFAERPVDRLDLKNIARKTARFSGADLSHLAAAASERALADALKTGNLRPIQQSDLLAVLDKVKPTTLEWLDTARRYVAYANQAGQYDEVRMWMEKEQ